MLEGSGVTKRFGGLVAVDAVDLVVHEGEIVGLIGPNGSGKTTLFNCIAGYYRPDAGRLTFRGHSLVGRPPDAICRLGIARTFQLTRAFADLSVAQNVAVGVLYGRAGINRVGPALAEARRLLDYVGLGAMADVRVGALTLAQRKRLELARALATRPRLLLLDESLAGLNPAEIAAAVELLRRLRTELGLTLLIVEHLMQVIMGLCDRVLVLDAGRKIADGPPEAVAQEPAVRQAYLGTRAVRAAREPG
ncbi:MAG TPA: ABC transporter ATP-binding protein [Chloroflexota bacterium]|nr:ABC transporter ATP-binding protein [Chloroflexota bacterium]